MEISKECIENLINGAALNGPGILSHYEASLIFKIALERISPDKNIGELAIEILRELFPATRPIGILNND